MYLGEKKSSIFLNIFFKSVCSITLEAPLIAHTHFLGDRKLDVGVW